MNPDAKVIAETEAQKGQTVTLDYDVLNSYTRLMAACIDNEGHYHIKGFNIGDEKVSFKSSATTRAAARRATSNLPDFSKVQLIPKNITTSFNAYRTIYGRKYSIWKDSHWENERLYALNDAGNVGGSWMIDGQSIYTDANELTQDELNKLRDNFNTYLYREDKNGVRNRRNNLDIIRNSNVVKYYDNELPTTGEPITLRPVQLASTEAYWCSIYYYYYKTSDFESSGLSKENFIKTLPKFKAIDLGKERAAFSQESNIDVDKADTTFRRLHEYLLPYYGDMSDFKPTPTKVTDLGFTTNGKIYRIKSNSADFYMTYTEDPKKTMKEAYQEGDANMDNQFWQVYTNDEREFTMLYNVGAQQFLYFPPSDKEYPSCSPSETFFEGYCFKTGDGDKVFHHVDDQDFSYIWEQNLDRRLKNDANTKIASDNKKPTSESMFLTRQWIFEPVSTTTANDATVDNAFRMTNATPSATIPAGYNIGFMIRKDDFTSTSDQKDGCLYGYGELNKQINKHGQFKLAMNDYGMKVNDARIAMFEYNGKTYLCFEEGADAQYSDAIVEMGGYDTDVYESDPTGNNESGQGVATRMLYDENELEGTTYMLLFEDRATSADYDMNDVVLRCKRLTGKKEGQVRLSLVAAGGLDNVKILGIEGEKVDGYTLNDREVHELFNKEDATGYERFVNTVDGQETETPISCDIKLSSGMNIPQFLAKIYIKNETTGDEIHVPKTGAEPLAIIMPFDFKYPKERQMITGAYKEFLQWAQDATGHNDWYNHIEENTVYPIDNIISK
jgi:hypothetical protein